MPPKLRKRSPSPKKTTTGAKPTAKPAKASAVASAAKPATSPPKGASKAAASDDSSAQVAAASTRIQRACRAFAARLSLGQQHKLRLKETLEAEGKRRVEQFENADMRRQREMRVARKSAEEREQQRQKTHATMCLAAFDGDIGALRKALAQGANVLKPDDDGNFALGEASVNGQVEAAKILLDAGSDPNSAGAFGRTPLWRAAYNSHADMIKLLLEHGADPRISAQSQRPEELASGAAKTALVGWDVSKTDNLKANQKKRTDDIREQREQETRAIADKFEGGVVRARGVLSACQQEVKSTRAELEKRIVELDLCMGEAGAEEKQRIALECVKDCEKRLAQANERLEDATREFLKLRAEQKAEIALSTQGELEDDDNTPTVAWSELGALLSPEWATKLSISANGTRFPVLIDVSAKAPVFFRYRDVNMVDTFRPSDLEPKSLRKSLIGSLRYGKPLVLDLHEACLWDFVVEAFNGIRPRLWDDVLAGKAVDAKLYTTLIDLSDDGPQYHPDEWRDHVTQNFCVVFVTTADAADELIPDGLLAIRTPTSRF